jgi:hypothetical protein
MQTTNFKILKQVYHLHGSVSGVKLHYNFLSCHPVFFCDECINFLLIAFNDGSTLFCLVVLIQSQYTGEVIQHLQPFCCCGLRISINAHAQDLYFRLQKMAGAVSLIITGLIMLIKYI